MKTHGKEVELHLFPLLRTASLPRVCHEPESSDFIWSLKLLSFSLFSLTSPFLTLPFTFYKHILSSGCLTTAGVLSVGFAGFVNGNKVLAQNMMRARVVAQFATVLAMYFTGMGYLNSKSPASDA